MYDYMRGLYHSFYKEPSTDKLQQAVSQMHQSLLAEIDQNQKKQFLKMIDTMDELQDEIALASFIAGFRLAYGILSELNYDAPYSFAEEEENRIREMP